MRSAIKGLIASLSAADFEPAQDSFRLCAKFFPMFAFLGLVAAIGRALQMGAAGEQSNGVHLLLEVVVEGSRLALLLHFLGLGSIAAGGREIRRLFTSDAWTAPTSNSQDRWRVLALSLVAFALVAVAANVAIFSIARQTPMLVALHNSGWIAPQADEAVIVLFLKNISVIPWTMAFIVALVHWLVSPPRTEPAETQAQP